MTSYPRYFVDPKKRAPEFVAAVEALKKTPQYVQAFAEVHAEKCHDLFAEKWNVTQAAYNRGCSGCISTLIHGRPRSVRACNNGCDRPPRCDHQSLWLRDRKPAVFVYQPYGHVTYDDVKELISYCDQRLLEFRIHQDSWHYPLSTVLIMIAKREFFAAEGRYK